MKKNILNLELQPLQTQVKTYMTKVVLFHLDGHQDEMELSIPRWTSWFEPQELQISMLQHYVYTLTRHFIRITHFEIHFGIIDDTGNKSYGGFVPMKFEIPTNKVYYKGKWVNPTKVKKPSDWAV